MVVLGGGVVDLLDVHAEYALGGWLAVGKSGGGQGDGLLLRS